MQVKKTPCIGSFYQNLVDFIKNNQYFPYGANRLTRSLSYFYGEYVMLCILYICQHRVMKFGMWLHLAYGIMTNLEIPQYAGCGYLYSLHGQIHWVFYRGDPTTLVHPNFASHTCSDVTKVKT
jgi:hypothetical protein